MREKVSSVITSIAIATFMLNTVMFIMKYSVHITLRIILKLNRSTAHPHGYKALSCHENLLCT